MTTSGFQEPALSPDLSLPAKLPEGLTLVEELDEVQNGHHQGSHLGEQVGPQHALRLGAHLQTWGPGREMSGRAPGLDTSRRDPARLGPGSTLQEV